MSLLVVAFREDKWIDWRSDHRYWTHLCRSYEVDFQLIDAQIGAWEKEVAVPEGHQVVVFDEVGKTLLSDFTHPENAVYVFGRTNLNDLPTKIKHDHSVRVNAPQSKSTFGISICGAVLYDRFVKWPSQ